MPQTEMSIDSTALKTWPRPLLLTALVFFVCVQVLGLLLRWQFVQVLPGFNYKFFLHAHSHVALLGWVHASLMVALMRAFLPAGQAQAKRWHGLFWAAQVLVLGMLFSFPVQGYAAVSITFSTLFLFVSYAQAGHLLRATQDDTSLSRRLLWACLWLMMLSSLGPWSLGPIMALKLNQSPVYFLAIYFYLHFQYNGWFVFALLALLLRWLEARGIDTAGPLPRRAVWLLLGSSLPAYALSALWTQPPLWVWVVAGAAALAQLGALALFWRWGWVLRQTGSQVFSSIPILPEVKLLLALAWGCFNLKLLLQALTAWPFFAQLAYQQRSLVIFYLHLVLLGVVTCALLAYLWQERGLQFNRSTRGGLGLFLLGFALSETLILLQGLAAWWGLGAFVSLPLPIFLSSLLILAGWLLIALGQWPIVPGKPLPADP
ncbi:MAG: hypothetical protein AB7I41_16435 [Candidatus Sericytochromatia bacterium]